jgi:hypothetical protein
MLDYELNGQRNYTGESTDDQGRETVYSIHIKLSKLLLQRMIRQPLIYAPVQHMIACAVTTLVKEGIRKSKDLGGGDAR